MMNRERVKIPEGDYELYKRLVDAVQDYAIIAVDRAGYILSWNTGAQRLNGYTAQEAIGEHFSIFYSQEDIDAHKPEFELRTAERVGRFEDFGWRVRKDGTRFWANVVISPLRGADGEVIGFSKVTRDITERKAAEEQLAESEQRFRALVQHVRDYAIFAMSADGRIQTWNEGARRIKGYDAEDIVGREYELFFTPEDRAAGLPQRLLRAARELGSTEHEGWRMRKDG
ncbi:MAG: PAS domain S-box protein, partial [Acidobacteriaceae bacterium]|nr:PAS domain S-box protein [Acidobacteriaceae bacterium]